MFLVNRGTLTQQPRVTWHLPARSRHSCSPGVTSRITTGALLWLLCFPTGFAMQLNAVASPRGTIVLDTQPVPVTRDANEVAPLRIIRHPNDANHAAGSLPVRDVCVFDPEVRGHTRCQAEVRMQGVFLHHALCVALGRDRHTTRCLRVVSLLPALPTEQYILCSTLQHWSVLCVPVDLRFAGGGISVHYLPCTATGEEVLASAAAAQRLPILPELYCQVGQRIMHSAAQVLLVEGGDTVRGLLRD